VIRLVSLRFIYPVLTILAQLLYSILTTTGNVCLVLVV
jgi:hypothetical protein